MQEGIVIQSTKEIQDNSEHMFVDMPRIFEAAMDKDMLNIFNEKNIILMNNGRHCSRDE
jgi:hypothetical protein